MDDIFLLASTSDAQVDRILRGIVGIYETAFPGHIRGYYLLGSYTDATSVPISDIDDEEIISSLRTPEAVDNKDLREAVKETIGRMRVLQQT